VRLSLLIDTSNIANYLKEREKEKESFSFVPDLYPDIEDTRQLRQTMDELRSDKGL
jgi:hypothetical protein